MRRRELVGATGVALVTLPGSGFTQAQAAPEIGFLASGTPAAFTHLVAAFRQGLLEQGFSEGRNIAVAFRWAEGLDERLPSLATELVRRPVAVIMATGGSAPALAAKRATATIPIVFTGGSDPVKLGLVASLSRPGGNATGAISIAPELTAKRLQLLRDMVPAAQSIAVLFKAGSPSAEQQVREVREAARIIGQKIQTVSAGSDRELDLLFAELPRRHAGALFVTADPYFMSHRHQLVALSVKHSLPASYPFRDMVLAGGLMSYGANLPDVYRQAGVYVARILNGAKPAELPVLQPTAFDLVINARAAEAFGITVPPRLRVAAEVIE